MTGRDRLARRIAASALLLVLGACAPVRTTPDSTPVDVAKLAAPFAVEGRISARRGSDAIAGNFAWTHDGEQDRITLMSPLGQTIAQLEGSPSLVVATMSDGRVEQAADWNALTSRALGLPVPVTGLSAWIRGYPRAGSPHTLEVDPKARPVVLMQDGWEIGYAYADEDAHRANRLTLRYASADPVEVRIVIDRSQ